MLHVGNTTDRRYILCGTVQVIVAARQMRSIQLPRIGRTCPVTGGIAAQSDPSIRIGVGNRDSHHLFQSATIETNGANRFIRIPVESDRSPLYSAAACILRSVPWSAPRYARVETESVPALHLRCGIGVHSYDANRVGRVGRSRRAGHISLRRTTQHFASHLIPRLHRLS